MRFLTIFCWIVLSLWAGSCRAQEWPYFVTYWHDLVEPDNWVDGTLGSFPVSSFPFQVWSH